METRARHDDGPLSNLADYTWLTGSATARMLDECSVDAAPIHLRLQRLRKVLSPRRAGLVVEQVELRRRGETKFGPLAAKMFFSEVALQQATDLWTAAYKASRLETRAQVHDYCCGIGGDLLALARRGPVHGWDRSPEVLVLAAANLRADESTIDSQVTVGHVEAQSPAAGDTWHLDPDRRSSGRRSTKLAWHSPGPEEIERLRQVASRGVLKLAPATTIPENWQQEAELEWISWDRQCRQLVVWFGALASEAGKRRATIVVKTDDPRAAPLTHSIVGESTTRAEVVDRIGEYVYDADSAVRAAGLTGALAVEQNLKAFGTEAGYLTGATGAQHPLLACFKVLGELPLRVSSLSKHLRKHGVGRLEIKKRGVDIDPEQLRRQLKLKGDASAALLLMRQGEREIAILADRCSNGVTASTSND